MGMVWCQLNMPALRSLLDTDGFQMYPPRCESNDFIGEKWLTHAKQRGVRMVLIANTLRTIEMREATKQYLNIQLLEFEDDFKNRIELVKREIRKAFSESWNTALPYITVHGSVFNTVNNAECEQLEGFVYTSSLMDNKWSRHRFISDDFIDKDFLFQCYDLEKDNNIVDDFGDSLKISDVIKNFFVSLYDAKHQKLLRNYLKKNYDSVIYESLKNIFFTRGIRFCDISKYGSYKDIKARNKYIENEWNKIRGMVVNYLFKLIRESSSESIYIPTMRDGVKLAFKYLLEKEYGDKKRYFSPLGYNRYYNCYFLLIVEINSQFFYQHRWLFPLQDKEDSFKDDTFAHRLIQIILEKEIEVLTFQLDLTTTYYVMDNSISITMLAARDLIEGRYLPGYEIYNAVSATTYEGEYCQGEIVFIEAIDMTSIMDDLILFSHSIPFVQENVRYIRKLLEMSDATHPLIVNNSSIIGIMNKNDFRSINYTYVRFSGFMKWVFGVKDKILFSYEEGRFRLVDSKGNLRWKQEVKCFFKNSETFKIASVIEHALYQKHGTMLVIFTRDIDAAKEVNRLVALDRGVKLEKPLDLSNRPEETLAMSSIDGAIMLDSDGMCYGFGLIVDGRANVPGTPSRGARYNSANTYVHSLNDTIECLVCVISEDSTIDIITSKHLVD